MFSKEELKERKSAFWEDFRKYMVKHRSVSGRRTNWINYPTRVKFIYVRLDVDSKHASFSVDIQPKDEGIREIVYEQFTELKVVMESEFSEPGNWQENVTLKNYQEISRIEWRLESVNMFKKEDKAKIFSFLEENLLAFDRFYVEFDAILIALAK